MARAALALVLAAVLLPLWCSGGGPLPRDIACQPEGRGIPPRHWIGCSADPGPRRDLLEAEVLALGLPIDPNRATAADLAWVPGLSRSLAAAIVREREADGPFGSVEDLRRVRGIGPRRLERAHASLVVRPVR